MKTKKVRFTADFIEAGLFLWIGILLVGIVAQNITRFFVVHRLKPFIAGTGIICICWGMQKVSAFFSSAENQQHQEQEASETVYHFRLLIFYCLALCVSLAVFQYRGAGAQRNTHTPAAKNGTITENELNSQIQRYPGGTSPSGSEAQDEAPLQDGAGMETSVNKIQTLPHTLTTASGQTLGGYYPDEKRICISDTEGAGWIQEIEEHTSLYTGWTITMKGCVVTDPAVFGPGMFCPSRELMTCCVADLSLIGFTCSYDTNGPFAALIHDGSWVTVTGILKQGDFQGQPEPQIVCTHIEKADPPADVYLYP